MVWAKGLLGDTAESSVVTNSSARTGLQEMVKMEMNRVCPVVKVVARGQSVQIWKGKGRLANAREPGSRLEAGMAGWSQEHQGSHGHLSRTPRWEGRE